MQVALATYKIRSLIDLTVQKVIENKKPEKVQFTLGVAFICCNSFFKRLPKVSFVCVRHIHFVESELRYLQNQTQFNSFSEVKPDTPVINQILTQGRNDLKVNTAYRLVQRQHLSCGSVRYASSACNHFFSNFLANNNRTP